MKFHEWFNQWFLKYKKRNISEVTQIKYRNSHRVIKERFGDMKLVDLTRDDIQNAIDTHGETRSRRTVRHLAMQIKACLLDAEIDGLISKSPYIRIVLHHKELNFTFMEQRELRNEKKWLEISEYDYFKGYLTSKLHEMLEVSWMEFGGKTPLPYYYMIVYVALKTGCRYAEVLGLTEQDVDYIKNTINIDKTWCHKYAQDFMATKNVSSVRKIVVDNETVAIIQKFLKWKTAQSSELSENAPIFIGGGKAIHSAQMNRELKRMLAECNIKYVSFHKLRHTQASYLLAKGVDMQVVAKRLGHTDTSMVQKVYGHLMEEVEEAENDKIVALL